MVPELSDLAAGGKPALARALARLEEAPESPAVIALLSAAYARPRAHVIGVTGPPGVGKSTLLAALIRAWRGSGRTVGCIAVDPSSRRTGGALLGDRVHLASDPADSGVYIRSMAARDRLGGLAELTLSAMVLMRALFDIVVIETVGVGQSETDVAVVADTVVFCVQPGSGDSLQFLKAGIAEIPHLVVVTKADMGDVARRAQSDMVSALALTSSESHVPVQLVCARSGSGVETLMAAIDSHDDGTAFTASRSVQGAAWVEMTVRERFGRQGARRLAGQWGLTGDQSPFDRLAEITEMLER